MGALITIMASLTGFFSQQLVQFKDCPQKDTTALVNISRTNSYGRIGGWAQSNVAMEYTPMVTAINVGLLESLRDLTSVLSSGCTSGNCTFSEPSAPSFSSLGFLHRCEDTTDRIRLLNETDSETYLGFDYGNNESMEWNRMDYGVVARSWVESSSRLTTFYIRSRPDYMSTDWKIVNCSLFPTVNMYTAKIENAVLEEILTDVSYLEPVSSNVPDIPDTLKDPDIRNFVFSWSHRTAKNHTIRNGTRELCKGSESSAYGLVEVPELSDEPTYVDLTGQRHPSAGWRWMYYPEDCVWTIYRFSMESITETMTKIFNNQSLVSGRKGGVSGSTHLHILFKEGNITFDSVNQRIEGLARSMTSVFRTDGGFTNTTDPYLQYSSGTLWVNTTCMYIRWSWISFPAAMIALTGVFLLLVTIENRSIETDRLWKSSFLAALFCEVELDRTPAGKVEMKSIARSTSVCLQKESSTLRLVHK
ncbi:hypothetical protein AA0120_g3987 [Alternaria tenuissima]|jgi:hypothetical protein|nr:hypothetical protein AA0120_g3987 [Alternaria tenuissima]